MGDQMTDYPLIRAMGLTIQLGYHVRADDLERALEKAPVLCGTSNGGAWFTPQHQHNEDRIARLVCIQPIKKETAEDLLRELTEKANHHGTLSDASILQDLARRARKLLSQNKA